MCPVLEGFKSSRTYSSYTLLSFLEGCSRKKKTLPPTKPQKIQAVKEAYYGISGFGTTWKWLIPVLAVIWLCQSLSCTVFSSRFSYFFSQLLDYRKAPKLSGQKLLWKTNETLLLLQNYHQDWSSLLWVYYPILILNESQVVIPLNMGWTFK